ncbi:MAG: outer membrane beta-barrel protein [Chitinophagaceae bacterium]
MKKFFVLLSVLLAGASVYAQRDSTTPVTVSRDTTSPVIRTPAITSPTPKKRDWSKVSLSNRSNDHFMVQVGYDSWLNKPDSILTKGISRSLNIYFMLDFPFKTNPRFSIGLGAGMSGGSIFFDKTIIAIAGSGTRLNFRNVADTNYYKKYKLATTYAEVPLELRFTANPQNNGKSFKVAIGGKVGTMLNAHTKGKNLQSKSGSTLNSFTIKESSKRFFNSTRLAATARVGYGVFSVFGVYQINNFLKEGAGADIRPYSIGIAFSGL